MSPSRLFAAIWIVWSSSAGAAGAELPVAAPAVGLVAALEQAPLVMVAEVASVRRGTGPHAHVATVSVERALVGEAPSGELRVTWDELAASRRPRLQAGEVALLGLEPVVGKDASLFRLASSGRAWWTAPDSASVNVLGHYLALAPSERTGPTGVRHLLTLSARAPAPLARSAAHRLANRASHGDAISGADLAALMVTALARADADGVARSLLQWVRGNPSAELVRALDVAIVRGDPAPAVYAARALLPEGLPDASWAALADSSIEAEREVVARYAPATQGDTLASLAGPGETSHQVRAAAVERLATVAFDAAVVVAALGDEHPVVRMAAAEALAARGDTEVPTLRRVAFEGTPREQQTAVTGLRIWGCRAAAAVLHEIVEDHPSEGMRRIAAIALGEPLGEVHPPHP